MNSSCRAIYDYEYQNDRRERERASGNFRGDRRRSAGMASGASRCREGESILTLSHVDTRIELLSRVLAT